MANSLCVCACGEAEGCPQGRTSVVGEMHLDSFTHSMDRCLVNPYPVLGFVQGLEEARVQEMQPTGLVSMVVVTQCDQCYKDGAAHSCSPFRLFTGSLNTPLISSPFVPGALLGAGKTVCVWGGGTVGKRSQPVGAKATKGWPCLLGLERASQEGAVGE